MRSASTDASIGERGQNQSKFQNDNAGQRQFSLVRSVKLACTSAAQNRVMPSETHHELYRTWAELAEAAKTDEKAWLFLVNFAPWATKLLEEPTRH